MNDRELLQVALSFEDTWPMFLLFFHLFPISLLAGTAVIPATGTLQCCALEVG